MARKARPRTATAATADPRERVIDAALELIAERGYAGLTMADVARAAGVTLAGLHRLFPSKAAVLNAFIGRIDHAMLVAAETADADASPRDRLFEVLMARLDGLKPHREAVRRIANDMAREPVAGVCLSLRTARSMRLALEAAGIGTSGLNGLFRTKGLTVIYLGTLRTWVNDDSEDMAKTMAALDRQLRRAELLARFCSGRGRGEASAEARS